MLPTICKNFRLITLKLKPSGSKTQKNLRRIKKLAQFLIYQTDLFRNEPKQTKKVLKNIKSKKNWIKKFRADLNF